MKKAALEGETFTRTEKLEVTSFNFRNNILKYILEFTFPDEKRDQIQQRFTSWMAESALKLQSLRPQNPF